MGAKRANKKLEEEIEEGKTFFRPNFFKIIIALLILVLCVIIFGLPTIRGALCKPCETSYNCGPCPIYLNFLGFSVDIAKSGPAQLLPLEALAFVLYIAVGYVISCFLYYGGRSLKKIRRKKR